MRLLLDTNTLARAFLSPGGPVVAILEIIESAPHDLIVSPGLLDELERILNYERLRRLHLRDATAVRRFRERIEILSTIVIDPPQIAQVTSDPDDDVVLAAAVAAFAQVLCTRDRHLRQPEVVAYCAQHGIQVLNDVELLRVLRQAAASTGE